MRNKTAITPIISPETRRIVRDELRSMDEGYYIIYCIITETGCPLQNLLDLKVSDMKGKATLTIPASKRYGTEKQASISPGLKEDIDAYLKDRNENDYAFTSRYTGNQLNVGTYKKALLSVSRYHGIEPPVTVSSLVKTYVYDLYTKGDHTAFTHSPSRYSYKGLHEYLGLDVPEDKEEYLTDHNPKTAFYKENRLSAMQDRIRTTMQSIKENTERPDKADAEYIKKVLRLFEQIDTAIELFKSSL